MYTDPIKKYSDLATKGFACFPIVPNEKRPLTPNGFKDASLDPNSIGHGRSNSPAQTLPMQLALRPVA